MTFPWQDLIALALAAASAAYLARGAWRQFARPRNSGCGGCPACPRSAAPAEPHVVTLEPLK